MSNASALAEFFRHSWQRPRSVASWPLNAELTALFYRHELLDAAAGDRLGKVDIALRIDCGRVAIGEMTCVVPGTRDDPADPEGAEHGCRCLVQQPHVVVVQIDIDDDFLAGGALGREIIDIGPEIYVGRSRRERPQNGGGVLRCGVLERIVPDNGDVGRRGLAGIEADIDYFLRRAQRLGIAGRRGGAATAIEHQNSAIRTIARIDIPVIAENDTMRVAATTGSERLGRTRLAVAWHAVDHACRAPLAIVLIGFTSVSSLVDDDAVVAVAVGNVDVSRRAGDRIS